MENWAFWQKVIIVFLAVVVVILAYRKLLRLVGGNSRFDNKFAYLHPVKQKEISLFIIQFELPVDDTVSLFVVDGNGIEVFRLVDQQTMEAGSHHYHLDIAGWSPQRYTLCLKSGNQTIERYFQV